MQKRITDDRLIDGCLTGDRNAQKSLFEKYRSTMLGVCMRYARDRDEAEDILMEAFVKVFLNIREFGFKGSFEGWIRKIMINTSINHYRKNLKTYYHSEINEVEEHEILEEESITGRFTADYLMSLINAMPDGYRMVFNLYEIEGYSHKEIAEMLGISVSTSKTQLFYAKKSLKKKIFENLKKDQITGFKGFEDEDLETVQENI